MQQSHDLHHRQELREISTHADGGSRYQVGQGVGEGDYDLPFPCQFQPAVKGPPLGQIWCVHGQVEPVRLGM
jgi:hypothetical protein